MYSYLPLGQRVLDEMQAVIDKLLADLGAQKMLRPMMQSSKGWFSLCRSVPLGRELYTLKDRKEQEYCLSPTNEEVITDIVKDLVGTVDRLNPRPIRRTTR